ncbi:efflux RND transporter periplasmic adaptor subunit [Roseivirga sp. BDSF3-8]|uniref:efflux RND transporter periplasmic adaptor subunit n=1 Tax=Roseivirga sp. BDSF3-8 TaxID=3241598 RepID=UPI003531B00F
MSQLKNNLKPALVLLLFGMIVGALLFAVISGGGNGTEAGHEHNGDSLVTTEAGEQVWTCSMHPQIRQPEPGDCPICGMDLIPMDEGGDDANSQAVSMSESAMRLANVQTTLIGTGSGDKTLRLDGRIMQDESREYSQVAQFPGRIEQLYITVTGEEIKRGQAIARIYSPELVTAQRELLEAEDFRESNPALFEAARQKLRNWKLSNAQIDKILASGTVQNTVTVFAQEGGVVTEKKVKPGDYVQQGQVLFAVANLEELWAVFNVYESELPFVKEGNEVSFTTPSVPGETFTTTINFVQPVIDTNERTAIVRGPVRRQADVLKPGMLISGRLDAQLAGQGEQLLVPRSAVLWTGTRSVVYVKEPGTEKPTFNMREVVLGEGAGDSYLVESGLQAGERVVTNGTFSVDAAAQLSNKPSMMNNPQEREMKMSEKPLNQPLNAKAKEQLEGVLEKYLYIKDLLVAAKEEEVMKEAEKLVKAILATEESALPAEGRKRWNNVKQPMLMAAKDIAGVSSIDTQRKAFIDLSERMIELATTFDITEDLLYLQHCPMADNNEGADWLSLSEQVRNPYYGDMMLTCGEVKAVLNEKSNQPSIK